jgi:hypothetical protein
MAIVEILVADQRRVALIAVAAVALVVCVLVGLALLIRPKTPFEREQASAEAGNPKWLKVEITTSDNRREYHDGEPIFVVAHFSSAARYTYKVDVADGFSTAAVDELHISNGQIRVLNERAFVCCSSRLVGLDDLPFTPPSTLLKLGPGDYEIYVTSRRLFKWDVDEIREKGIEADYPSSFEVASKHAENSCSGGLISSTPTVVVAITLSLTENGRA